MLVSYKVSLPHETDSACMQFSSIINAAGLTFQFNAQFTLPARHDKTVLSVLCELDNCYQCVQTSVFCWQRSRVVENLIHTAEADRHGRDRFVGSGLAV